MNLPFNEIFKALWRSRFFDERAILLQRSGRLGTFPSSKGQEAFFLAAAWFLQSSDWYCPYYRDHSALIHRGVLPRDLLAYWGGNEQAFAHWPACTLPICIPIGSQTAHAVGIAHGLEQPIALTTLGDGACSRGDVYEAMNFAGIHQLPVVFAINNNGYAISVPIDKQSKEPLMSQKFSNLGLQCLYLDKVDISSLFQAFSHVVNDCRQHRRPWIIEVKTQRLDPHTTADDDSRYRSRAERQAAWQDDLLTHFNQDMQRQQGEDKLSAIKAKLKAEIAAEASAYLQMPAADFGLNEHLYQHTPNSWQDTAADRLNDHA